MNKERDQSNDGQIGERKKDTNRGKSRRMS